MKEFVYFPTTDVFVPVSQLSTRDLLDFLENLKIRQDMLFLSWISRRVRWVERRALWYPYSRLFFGIVFKKILFLEFYKVNYSVNIGFWHISFRKMFKSLTCKKNHDFLSLGCHDENVFYLKDFMTWLSLWDVIRHFCFSGRGRQVFLVRFVKRKAPYKIRCHVEISFI